MSDRRVVITGMGIITSLGESVDPFWDRLINGESGIGPITSFDSSDYEVHFGGECVDFRAEDYIDRREIKRLDRFAQLAIGAACNCHKDSGLDLDKEDPSRVGVIVGSGIGGLLEIEQQHKRLLNKGPSKVSAFTIPKLMANAGGGNISIMFNAQGPCTTVVTACASASHAMGDALTTIQRDEADIIFTGGAEAAVTPLGIAAFAAMKALSLRNDEPQRASRPFDRDRDGFVMGEGAGMLIVEELEHAKKRGAKIYAELSGVGASGDAGHITQPAENGQGAFDAMKKALCHAKLNPQDVHYINAHGTGTPLGDIAETVAIKRLFGDHAFKLSVSSTKSAIGHLLGASGGVEMVAVVMAIKHNIAPPTINLDNPDPRCDLDYVPNQAKDMKIDVALSNSFGFGGHNACVCVRRFD
ncbi:MAG: beta-ketoacyl-ACP synthase II [Planctomycetes bacterium]|nr:beta-ketoacyl-ACP synthase II [Planctomycetota bacterium]